MITYGKRNRPHYIWKAVYGIWDECYHEEQKQWKRSTIPWDSRIYGDPDGIKRIPELYLVLRGIPL